MKRTVARTILYHPLSACHIRHVYSRRAQRRYNTPIIYTPPMAATEKLFDLYVRMRRMRFFVLRNIRRYRRDVKRNMSRL